MPPTTFILHLTTLYTKYRFYLNWIWRKKFEICKVLALRALPLGPHRSHYHMNNFESPAPRDDSCHVWLKSNHVFSKKRWNSYFLQRAHRGPLGPPWELPWTTFVLHLTRYTHYITWLFSFWIWRRRCLKFAWFWPFSPWAPMGATHTIWTTLNPLPLRMIPAIFFFIQPCIFKKKMKQLLFTKGPQGPIGATLGTAMNKFFI